MMIDVLIPALDGCYDFELDGEMPAEKVVEEIIALVEKKEKIKCKDRKRRYLYVPEQNRLLKVEDHLLEQGIKSGDRLILV